MGNVIAFRPRSRPDDMGPAESVIFQIEAGALTEADAERNARGLVSLARSNPGTPLGWWFDGFAAQRAAGLDWHEIPGARLYLAQVARHVMIMDAAGDIAAAMMERGFMMLSVCLGILPAGVLAHYPSDGAQPTPPLAASPAG